MKIRKQRYEININSKKIILIDNSLIHTYLNIEKCLLIPYLGKAKTLFQYIDSLENSDRFNLIVLHTEDLKLLWSDFKKVFKQIPAAGGLILNSLNQVLMIYRRGHWDLPKGKLDEGEDFQTAALRECKEEVGLEGLILYDKIINTYHVYREKNNARVLKKTKWYIIKYDGIKDPVIQTEEDIEKYIWIDLQEINSLTPIYENIKTVITDYCNRKA